MTRLSMYRGGQRNHTQLISISQIKTLSTSCQQNSIPFENTAQTGFSFSLALSIMALGAAIREKPSTLLASLSLFILAISQYLLTLLLVQMLWSFVSISCPFLFSSVLSQCVVTYLFHLFRSLTLSNASSLFLVLKLVPLTGSFSSAC